MDFSVVIPSYKDPCLHRTIDDLLKKCETNFEVIPVIDGYELTTPIIDHHRVKPVYLDDNVGMRGAINAGVKASRGKYICRSDEHCIFGQGFDRIILETIQDNWIVVPRRYFLDTDNWKVMDLPPIDYEKLLIITKTSGITKFHGIEWRSRTKKRKDIAIDETMAMQGSMWVMPRKWWDEVIGELQSEGYGTLQQDTTEMLFKTWRAGGKLMLNKLTWYAHRHKSFRRVHTYSLRLAKASYKFAIDTWRDDYETVRMKWAV